MNDQVEDMENVLADIAVRLMSLENTVSEPDSEINRLQRVIDLKDKTIHDLENRLSKYEDPPKDSHNSSIPPTLDSIENQIVRHTKTLRKKNGRKPGGQPGHKGHSLEKCDAPDFTVDYFLNDVCECGGESLESVKPELLGTSQVIDTPPVKPVIVEHALYGKRCKCGHMNKC